MAFPDSGSESARDRRYLGLLGVAYASASAVMFWQERAMRRDGGPGIVGLELAGSTERVEAILAAWGPLLAGLCGRAGGRFGPALARAQYVAAACDVAENTALLAVLAGRRARLPAFARAMAVAKFALLGAGVAQVTVGAVRRC